MKLIIFIVSFLTFGVQAASDFDSGVEAFQAKKYDSAIAFFNAAVKKSPSDISSYYNLGLAHKEQENYSEALWAFEKVLRYSPNDGEVKELARFCYDQLHPNKDWSPRIGAFKSALYSLTAGTWAIMSIILAVLFAGSLFVFTRSTNGSWRRVYILMMSASMPLMIACILIGNGANKYMNDSSFAITLMETATHKDGSAGSAIDLPAGERLKKVAEKDKNGFIKVRIESGSEHLVKETDLAFI